MRNMTKWARKQGGFSLIELMVVVAVLGIVAAIAVPNFLLYQMRSRQTEVRANLAGIFVAEVAFFGENTRYSAFNDIGFALAGSANRYTYRAQDTNYVAPGPVTVGAVETLNAGVGVATVDNQVVGAASMSNLAAPGFTATATANLDNDLTLDEWHVNDIKQSLGTADTNDVLS